MISRALVSGMKQARGKMSGDSWQQVIAQISRFSGSLSTGSISQATNEIVNRDAAWIISQSLEKCSGTTWSEIEAVMKTVEVLIGDGTPSTEIIWTGPTNERFPVRRIDQVLYDLILKAKKRILLVTFAANRVPHLCTHLRHAVQRGIELTLIVEREDESEGQLSWDAITAFKDVPLAGAKVYYWPIEKRERNQAGKPGKLHTKCAIIDNIALIGSANLTDDAFNRNMELGMLVREEATVVSLADHFRELISLGVLAEVQGSSM